MKKKILGILVLILIIGAFVANHLITYARVATTPLYVNLATTDLKNVGYGIGNPNPSVGGTSNQGEYIWNIRTYDSANVTAISTVQRNLYCVKADYGQTWFTEQKEEEIVEYNLYYDMQEDRETLLANLKDNGTDADDVVKELLNPNGNQYRQLLWLFDNSYIPGQTNIDDYMAQVGILPEENGGQILYYNKDTNQYYPNGDPLTEQDIMAIQKMAIWYFTNGAENDTYDKTDENLWLNITTDGTDYETLKIVSESRNAMAMDLYKYLIASAKNGANQYTAENGYKLDGEPVKVNTSGLIAENDKYVLETKRVEGNYVVGPIKIDKNNDLGYDIEILVTDKNDNELDSSKYAYTDKDGNVLQNVTTVKDLVGMQDGFYISVSRGLVESINIKVSISYKTTPKKLWLDGTEDSNGIILNSEQPLVEVTQDPIEVFVELTSELEEFDLALRKYITAVNGVPVTNTRVPVIEQGTLLTGTTATYKHRKDPVVVQDKDEVTYKLTIYNEGNKAGYATKIIDQLPTGLISSTNNSSVVVSKGPNGEERNQYKLQYDSYNNQIVLTLIQWPEELEQGEKVDGEGYVNDIKPYTTGNLDYETIEIKCIITQAPDTKNQIILTNVAWIAAAYDSVDQVEILRQGQDRDSEPQTSPNVDKDNMEDYKGNSTNKSELSDSGYFYKGQQDDDDFEKLVIMPVEKIFDLALFKHIAAISKDEIIENGEYVTDNKNIDGTYLRAPVVKSIDPKTGKITYEQDSKEALAVEPGDYVLYTIRVYNEGEVNGYASKIKDTLPIGLEFVVSNEEYNGKWNLDGLDADGRQVVTTTWFAKGNGDDEITPGSNLLKALNKEGAISNENPDYIDAQVLCKVVERATSSRVLVNYAQISDDTDENGDPIDDIDSTPDEWIDEEDDQDIERIQLQYFDLSLRKFITQVQEKEVTTRVPQVDTTPLKNGQGTAEYTHPKDPLIVHTGDVVIYTLRIYNEGRISGYASEITDDIPEYLEYLPEDSTNVEYMWKMYDENGKETENVEKAVKIKTTYLSKENGEENLIKAFEGDTLSYKDIKVAFKVKDPNSNTYIITNHAQISDDTDESGNPIKDKDSITDEWNENEDDQDIENVKVQYFDLSLLKFVSKVIVIENGKETITTTGYNGHENPEPVVKVELQKKKLSDVVVKFGYGITITNEGDIPGYATEITDYVPEGLKFVAADNPNWTDEGNNVISTKQLENTLLQPGQSETIEVIFTWINGPDNLSLKTNTAEISQDKNEYDVPDKDSTPDNKKDEEDDIDIAKVILAIKTGAAQTYFSLTLGLLAVIATGIVLIKKFVI